MSALPSLYSLTGQYRSLMDLDIPPEEKQDTLDLISESIEEKGKHIGYVLQSFDAQESALKSHLADVQGKIKAIQNHRDRLKSYLQENMERCGIQRIESDFFTISLQKSPDSVAIDDESAIPDDYCRFTRSVDKTLIKAALKDGYQVPGAHLQSSNHVRIR